ncbi:MAG: XRE family transcriptional regulator [Desulfobacteraceae bacterium 4572_130]|nr:MAG: XRE family transcriptional regulator [Desulfobacteraceae bacterium 4572_130]
MGKDENTSHLNIDYFKELTGTIKQDAPTSIDEVGKRIKILREKKGITINEVSQLTGFGKETLQDIENGVMQPPLGTIMKLSKALDSAVGQLVSGTGSKIYSITRKNEKKKISKSTSQKGRQDIYSYMSLAPEVQGRHMEPVIVQLKQNPVKDVSVHDGEEFIYVLEGIVELFIGDEVHILEPGDSSYYLSTTPHLIMAKQEKAIILAVLYH